MIRHDDDYDAPIYRYQSISAVPWSTFAQQPDKAVRIIIQDSAERLPLDVIYIPRNSSRLFVGFHGAETQSITDLPKFQFIRSFLLHRKESFLFLSDSTLLNHEEIRIGWMSGQPEFDLAPAYAGLIRAVTLDTGIIDTVLIGHSAGATAAIRVGSMVPDSRAIGVNGQLSADYYHPEILTTLRTKAFNDPRSDAAFLDAFRDRLDLRCSFESRAENSTFSWFTHAGDVENSLGDRPSYPQLVSHFGLGEDGGLTPQGDSIALCDWDSTNVNPHALPGTVIPFINAVLGEPTNFDLQIRGSVNPIWKSQKISHPSTSRIKFKYRGSNPSMVHDDLYDARIYRYSTLNEVPWDTFEPGTRARIIVQSSAESMPIDVLYIPRDSNRLLVGFHGAEPRNILDAPKFQFLRSFITRSESLLFVADSTLLMGEKINIGWLAGNMETPLASLVSRLIADIGISTNLEETILIGHSAGGFAAILVGSQVPNSRAISINGQSVVTRYQKWTVNNLQKEAFPECESIEEMENLYAKRIDLRVALQGRLESSSFSFFSHISDDSSFGSMPHFPLLAEAFGLGAVGGRTSRGDAFVAGNWELNNALPHALPGVILPFIELTLGEPTNFFANADTDSYWDRSQ